MCYAVPRPPCPSPRVISVLTRIRLMTATRDNMASRYTIPNSLRQFILTTHQGNRCSVCLHLADEETEAQRSKIILSQVTHPVS